MRANVASTTRLRWEYRARLESPRREFLKASIREIVDSVHSSSKMLYELLPAIFRAATDHLWVSAAPRRAAEPCVKLKRIDGDELEFIVPAQPIYDKIAEDLKAPRQEAACVCIVLVDLLHDALKKVLRNISRVLFEKAVFLFNETLGPRQEAIDQLAIGCFVSGFEAVDKVGVIEFFQPLVALHIDLSITIYETTLHFFDRQKAKSPLF